ncbi:MAG: FHA domain-containing protein [Myxococcales bacterium]|nr:FHA domain-containing protein [Myxococcales bacterium]
MITCPNCSRDNENHYKFCLGCGTELGKAPRMSLPAPTALPLGLKGPAAARMGAALVPPAKPAVKNAPPRVIAIPEPPEPPEPPEAQVEDPMVDEVAIERAPEPTLMTSNSEILAAMAAEAAGHETELPWDHSLDASADLASAMAAAQMAGAISDEVPFPHVPTSVAAPLPTHSDARLCVQCGAAVPDGFKFCGVCGTRHDASPRRASPAGSPVFVPLVQDVQAAPARLVVIHPDGTEGDVFPLTSGETTVGRSHPSSIFSEDPFLSPRHATFYFVKGQLFARDEASLNGVFLRIKGEVEIFHGDMFRIGQQLVRFEEMTQVRPVLPGAGDGTAVMGSPVRGAWGRLSAIVALQTPAAVWVLRRAEENIGRERGEITFPEDGFVSGGHCKLSHRTGRYFLTDVDSTNGTYLRVKAEAILSRHDLILLGQQLFKIEISA